MIYKNRLVIAVVISMFFSLSGLSSEKSNNSHIVDLSKLKNSKLKCARIKNGIILQLYNANLNNGQIWINNKNYTKRYKVSNLAYEELATKGESGDFCNIIDPNATRKSSTPITKIKCVRIKNGKVLQYYNGSLKNEQIWINNKNYTTKYKMSKVPYEELAAKGENGSFCNVIDPNATKKPLTPITKLKCARIKNGMVLQYYNGSLKNKQIWIKNKNYTGKYIVIDMPLDEKALTGAKGHFCNIVK